MLKKIWSAAQIAASLVTPIVNPVQLEPEAQQRLEALQELSENKLELEDQLEQSLEKNIEDQQEKREREDEISTNASNESIISGGPDPEPEKEIEGVKINPEILKDPEPEIAPELKVDTKVDWFGLALNNINNSTNFEKEETEQNESEQNESEQESEIESE